MVSYRTMSAVPGRPSLRLSLLVALIFAAACVGGCTREEPPELRVRDTDILLQNRTNARWTAIEVWVNDHFRGVAPELQPYQQMVVPLDSLQAAFGQRFDRSRQTVFGVLVTAKSDDGSTVRLMWGKVRRR